MSIFGPQDVGPKPAQNPVNPHVETAPCPAARSNPPPPLCAPAAPPRKFYLIAKCNLESRQELTAVPVTGECELAGGAFLPLTGTEPSYVRGLLAVGHETVAIVSLEKLVSVEATA